MIRRLSHGVPHPAPTGTAVADLQYLDKNSDMLQNFDALDEWMVTRIPTAAISFRTLNLKDAHELNPGSTDHIGAGLPVWAAQTGGKAARVHLHRPRMS